MPLHPSTIRLSKYKQPITPYLPFPDPSLTTNLDRFGAHPSSLSKLAVCSQRERDALILPIITYVFFFFFFHSYRDTRTVPILPPYDFLHSISLHRSRDRPQENPSPRPPRLVTYASTDGIVSVMRFGVKLNLSSLSSTSRR